MVLLIVFTRKKKLPCTTLKCGIIEHFFKILLTKQTIIAMQLTLFVDVLNGFQGVF